MSGLQSKLLVWSATTCLFASWGCKPSDPSSDGSESSSQASTKGDDDSDDSKEDDDQASSNDSSSDSSSAKDESGDDDSSSTSSDDSESDSSSESTGSQSSGESDDDSSSTTDDDESSSSADSTSTGSSDDSGSTSHDTESTTGAESTEESEDSGDDGSIPERCQATGLNWRTGHKTWYQSYPDPDSDECTQSNGCHWAGLFAACGEKKPESWVMERNIAAVFPSFRSLRLHDLCLRHEDDETGEVKYIIVTVFDTCADSDCSGCCTQNQSGTDQLIDLEWYTNMRWGVNPMGNAYIEWADLGPTQTEGCGE